MGIWRNAKKCYCRWIEKYYCYHSSLTWCGTTGTYTHTRARSRFLAIGKSSENRTLIIRCDTNKLTKFILLCDGSNHKWKEKRKKSTRNKRYFVSVWIHIYCLLVFGWLCMKPGHIFHFIYMYSRHLYWHPHTLTRTHVFIWSSHFNTVDSRDVCVLSYKSKSYRRAACACVWCVRQRQREQSLEACSTFN